MLGFAALALLPDVDLLLHAIAPDVALFEHRGPSHSLALAMLVAVLIASLGRSERRLQLGALAFVVLASHGLLDAFGDSRVGVELLWPLSDVRFQAPWHVLPNIDVSRRLPGVIAELLVELALFTPAWVYALWPRTRSR